MAGEGCEGFSGHTHMMRVRRVRLCVGERVDRYKGLNPSPLHTREGKRDGFSYKTGAKWGGTARLPTLHQPFTNPSPGGGHGEPLPRKRKAGVQAWGISSVHRVSGI